MTKSLTFRLVQSQAVSFVISTFPWVLMIGISETYPKETGRQPLFCKEFGINVWFFRVWQLAGCTASLVSCCHVVIQEAWGPVMSCDKLLPTPAVCSEKFPDLSDIQGCWTIAWRKMLHFFCCTSWLEWFFLQTARLDIRLRLRPRML